MPDKITVDSVQFPAVSVPARTLLGPGPSMVDPRVMRVMNAPVVGHLDPTFLEVMDQIQDLLRYVFQTENDLTLLVPGTGTAAMETAVANMVEPGDNVLICASGYFGLRIGEMAQRYGGSVETITRPWGEAFSASDVSAALARRPAKVVAIVHGETSTGVRQPIEDIARAVHAQGGLLIVDTVASLGGEPVFVDGWDIDICYSGSQKCLSCVPGVAPITLGSRALAKLEARQTPVANWYLDLTLLRKYWDERRAYHHTAPVTLNYAFHEALRLVAEEGLENRWTRHRQVAEQLWAGLEALGMSMHVPLAERLATLTTVRLPEGLDEAAVRRTLLHEYNIEVAGGLGELKGKVWRVGLMGYSARSENVLLLLAALRELLP